MIKYLGSKRTLIPALSALGEASGAKTALDLFTGTTRVAQAYKRLGMQVTAADSASYSYVFAKTWIELDANSVNPTDLTDAIAYLNALPGEAGYFTQSFCLDARFFQPKNGERVDSIRTAIETEFKDSWLYYPLLASLIMATDKVDSTTGVQMAFLKDWSPRSKGNLQLKDPGLLAGKGTALQGDVLKIGDVLPAVDLAYLDPPYNQHRYYGNYHVWETLVRWDAPESYGVANKRLDVRDKGTKSAFNSKKTMPAALAQVITNLQAETIVLSYNNESWLSREQLAQMCGQKETVAILDFDFKRYVGSVIGVYNKQGLKVGEPTHTRNVEHMVLAGPSEVVERMVAAIRA